MNRRLAAGWKHSAVLLALAAACGVGHADESRTLVLAQLRPDGIVVPFARFSEGHWNAVCAEELGRTTSEENYWLLLQADGRTDTLNGGDWLDTTSDSDGEQGAACRGQMTDYRPRSVADEVLPTTGIVLSNAQGAALFENLNEGSEMWRHVMVYVAPEFERQESTEVAASIARDPGSKILWWGHPLSGKARRAIPMTAAITRAVSADGTVLFHATASREYPPPPRDEACSGHSVLNTWVRDESGQLSASDGRLAIDNCDQKSMTFETPLISLSVGGRTFVIVDEVGYEWGAYNILEWTGGGFKLSLESAYHCL